MFLLTNYSLTALGFGPWSKVSSLTINKETINPLLLWHHGHRMLCAWTETYEVREAQVQLAKVFFTTYFLKVPFGIQRCKSFLAIVLQSICMQEFKAKRSICWKYWHLHSIKATTFSLMQKISGETVFLSEDLMPPSSIWQKLLQEKVTLL